MGIIEATPHVYDTLYKPMGNQSFTVAVWSKKKANSTNDWTFQFGTVASAGAIFMEGHRPDNTIRFTNTNLTTTTNPFISGVGCDADKWVHLAFTYGKAK